MELRTQILMDMIRAEICGETPDLSPFLALTKEEQHALAELAKQQMVDQFLGDALAGNKETSAMPLSRILYKSMLITVNQVTKNELEQQSIVEVLEDAQIPYILLKGARIRPYYPQPWMRASCDIDILVPQEKVERTAQLLIDKLEYRLELHNSHDISLFSPTNVHLELHFSLLENLDPMDQVLSKVWENSAPVSEGSTEYIQSNEFFMFHLMAHTVHHVMTGGCGIRPFLDLFVLRDRLSYEKESFEALCREAGVLRFSQNAWNLADVWFCGKPHTEATKRLERYVLSGGSFGSKQSSLQIETGYRGGKLGYTASRLWPSTERLSIRYPILTKYPYLMPIYQVRRWCSLIVPSRFARIYQEANQAYSSDSKKLGELEQMLRENGLN